MTFKPANKTKGAVRPTLNKEYNNKEKMNAKDRKACLPASTSKRIYHGIGVTVFLPLDGLLLLTQLSYSLSSPLSLTFFLPSLKEGEADP